MDYHPLNNLNILLVSENDDIQGIAFQEYFLNFSNVLVTKNLFEEYETIDCLVIPSPSSFFTQKENEVTDYYLRY